MNAIVFYTHQKADQMIFEYNFYDNKFAPSNLVVRKILMAMMQTLGKRLTHLEVEYNDAMLAEKLGKRGAELLRFLGASKDNLRENKSGEVVVSRSFTAELNDERFDYFYRLLDLSELPHYELIALDKEKIVFYFNQYLSLTLTKEDQEQFFTQLEQLQVPYKLVSV